MGDRKAGGISVHQCDDLEYDGHLVNLLIRQVTKTLREDTYRTLTAVDSVVLVVDRNGVEEQTRRLMEVISMRKTPVIVFINKNGPGDGKNRFFDSGWKRSGKELKIQLHPMTIRSTAERIWAYGDLSPEKPFVLSLPVPRQMMKMLRSKIWTMPSLDKKVGEKDAATFKREDVELIWRCLWRIMKIISVAKKRRPYFSRGCK